MADPLERILEKVTKRIKERKTNKENNDPQLKFLDEHHPQTADDFHVFVEEQNGYRTHDESVLADDTQYVTLDEWNNSEFNSCDSDSSDTSVVPSKFLKLDSDQRSSSNSSTPKLRQLSDNSPVLSKLPKLDNDPRSSRRSSTPKVDNSSNNSSVQSEFLNLDNDQRSSSRSSTPKFGNEPENSPIPTAFLKLDNNERSPKSSSTPKLANLSEKSPVSSTCPELDHKQSTSKSITPKILQLDEKVNNEDKENKSMKNVLITLVDNSIDKSSPKQDVVKTEEKCEVLGAIEHLKPNSDDDKLVTIIIGEDQVQEVTSIPQDIPETERNAALSILDGWPPGVVVDELFVLVTSGNNQIRTLQRIKPSMEHPQLLLRVTSCVSNSPLKIVILGLERLKTNNVVYYKVTAEGQTEIEKGKKTDRITLEESTGIDCAHLLSSDNFQNIKHAATSHIPESTYEVYIQNLIPTHLTKKARVTLLQNLDTKTTYIFMEELRDKLKHKFKFPFDLPPCTNFNYMIWLSDYEVNTSLQVFCGTSDFCDIASVQSTNVNIMTSVKALRTYMTKVELRRLADMATGYVVGGCHNQYAYLQFFYRNKPERYFQDIYNRDNGVMQPYMKDNNGDPSSIINGNIKGLFFSALLERKTLKPPKFSFFGSRRIYIYSHWMFHEDSNLYFADFYCHYDIHYVTVVLTEPGSATDQFCRERLLLLNKFNNPFIKLVTFNGESKVYVTLGVHIEVLYTEPIDLYYVFNRQMGFLFEDVPTKGRGSSIHKFGIPKKADCKICNL